MERAGSHGLEERAPEARVERVVLPTETVMTVFVIWRLFLSGIFRWKWFAIFLHFVQVVLCFLFKIACK